MTCDIVMTVAQEAATRGQVGGGSNHTTADVLCHIMSAVHLYIIIVKLRQGSGKDRQGMAVKAKGIKA